MKSLKTKTNNVGWLAVLLPSVIYGFLVIPIDLLLLLKSNSSGLFFSMRLALRSCGWIMFFSVFFLTAIFIVMRAIQKIRANNFEVPIQHAVLLGSGIFVPLFFFLFNNFYDKFKIVVAVELIGGMAALVIAWICQLLLRPAARSRWLAEISPKAGVFGALVIVICFSLSFINTEGARGTAGFKSDTGKSDLPNILLIVMDTVRADHLSLYGYHLQTTPFLEKMGEEGVVFNNAFAASPWTLPSHASIFTGLYPSQHHAHGEHFWLDDSYRTLAEILSENGFQTVSFSNNDYVSSYHNLTQGFERSWYKGDWTDSFKNIAVSSPSLSGSVVNFYNWLRDQIKLKIIKKIIKNPVSVQDYPSAAVANKAIFDWLDEGRDNRRPFFMFINYMDAHIPYNPNDDTARLFLSEKELKRSYQETLRFPPIEYCLDLSKSGYTENDIHIISTLYDACIRYLDAELEKLILQLKRLGIHDNTLIIITSDHGEYLGTHNRLAHGLGLHSPVLHVPMMARYPDMFTAGKKVDTVVTHVDIFETILSFAKIDERPENMPDTQLLSQIKDDFRSNIFAEFHYPLHLLINASLREDNSKLFVEQKTIRNKTNQLIWKSRGDPEFYDVNSDPLQLENLYSKDNKKAESMNQQLALHFRSIDYTPQTVQKVIDAPEKEKLELLERLRGIGYLK